MNEHSTEILPNLLREDAFPTVRKGGYDKRQVDDFVVRNHNQLRDLQERLARAHDELEQLRRELTEAKAKAVVKPEHEQISERLANILRIADEEAADKRSRIDKEVGEIRGKADQESAAKIKSAQEQSERVVSSARDEAKDLLASAKQEAERLRDQVVKESERKLSEAETRSHKIHETADRRLATLTATHGEAVRRLNDMRDTLADLLKTENKAGILDTGLKRSDFEGRSEGRPEDKPADSAPAPAARNQPVRPATPAAPPAPAPAASGSRPASSPRPAEPAKPAAAPRPKPDDDEVTVRTTPVGNETTVRTNPVGDETTTRTPPVDEDEATVRLSPEDTKAAQQATPSSQPVRQHPGRPQGFRYSGPSPDEPTTPVPQGGDPGITGMYRRPDSDTPKKPDDDSTEGVRVIKP